MEPKVYFAMYKFNIRYKKKHRLEKNYLHFNNIKREGDTITLMDIFKEIFPKNKFIRDNLRVTDILEFNDEEDFVSGLINLGEYGNVRNIYNKTDGEFKEKVEENDVVCEPFFFMFSIPSESNEGFLILERKKSKPFTGSFFDCLKEQIKTKYDGFITFDFIHVIPREAKPLFENSSVVEFIFLENEKNSQRFGDSQVNYVKRKIVWDIRTNHFTLKEVKAEPFYSNIKEMAKDFIPYAKIKHNKREQIVNLDDIYENKIFYIELEDLTWGEDKNPEYNYLKTMAMNYAKTNFSYFINQRSIFDNDG